MNTTDAAVQGGLHKQPLWPPAPQKEHKDLADRIARVTGEVGDVPRSGFNAHLDYHYSTLEDCFHALAEPLAKNGVAIVPAVQSAEPKGNDWHVWLTIKVYTEGGSSAFSWFGTGNGPRGVYGAFTSALRTWLVQTFKLKTPEPDAADETPEEKKAGPARPAQQRQVPKGACTPAQVKMLWARANSRGLKGEEFKAWLKARFNIERLDDVPRAHVNTVRDAIDAWEPPQAELEPDVPADSDGLGREADETPDEDVPF
jgi:hypothetical protein